MGAVVGIDLGTTNTVVAAIRDGRPVALPDESGSTLIPSIVSFLPSGAVLVGSAAKERRSQDARNTIYSVKRLIGRTWDSSEVREATARFPFELREGPGRATFVIARGETYTLPEISAFVLRKAKSIAELELGEPVDRAVITVPANFNDLQRAATKVAGRVAGLEVLRILNEPTAAALAFGHTRGNRERIAIYDFGGGTFDMTLLLLTDDVFEVLATAGDTFLGGDDIDTAIVDRMVQKLPADFGKNLRAQPETLERLRAAAEQLKLELSTTPEARIHLDENEVVGSGGLDFVMTRDELDRIVSPVVTRTFKVCHDALSMAKLGPKDIDHVLLVGGTTQSPLVRRQVEEYFGRRARADLDPHEVVALGAAQQAMALTQVRATASGIPVAPPPRRALGSSSNEGARDGQDQALGADDASRKKTDPLGGRRKITDAGVGDGEDSVKPVRVSVVPPEGPLSHPAPTTQNFGSRERRTTGVGIGPSVLSAQPTGVAPVTPAVETLEVTTPPSTLSGLGGKATSPGLSEQRQEAASLPDIEDLPLPLVPTAAQPSQANDPGPAAARREFTRGPTVRVTRGTAAQPDLTATLSSANGSAEPAARDESSPSTDPLFGAVVHPLASPKTESSPSTDPLFGAIVHPNATPKTESSPKTDPLFGDPAKGARGKSVRETAADEGGAWDKVPDYAGETGLPIVTGTTRLTPERRAVTALGQDSNQTSARNRDALPTVQADLLADLPLVVSQPKSSTDQSSPKATTALVGKQRTLASTEARDAFAKTENSPALRLGLPDPGPEAFADAYAGAGADAGNEDEDGDDDSGADEPTVVRRSLQSSSELRDGDPTIAADYGDDLPARVALERFDEPTDLPATVSSKAPTSAAPATPQRSGKPTSLTEDEIRARYGNLPLIVGGKRVGPRTAELVDEPESSQVLGAVTRRTMPPPVAAPLPAPRLPKLPTVPPRDPEPLEPEYVEPEYVEPEYIEPELQEPASRPSAPTAARLAPPHQDEAVPKSQRLHSTRPSARQNSAEEFELPIPDLPPQRPTAKPTGPALGSTRPLPAPQPAAMADASGIRRDAGPLPVTERTAPIPRVPQREPNWGAGGAFNATLPLGAAGLTTAAWQPPATAGAEPVPAAASQPQPFEVPSLLASLPKSASIRPALLIDVTPLSLCVETVGGYVDTVISRNTPVPCERTRDFVTAHDNQQSVIVRVAQGESKQFLENVLLGEVQLTGIPPAPRGQSRIAVTFGIDSDGILHVRALDVMSGQSALADLRLQGAPSSPEVAQMMARHAAKSPA